MRQKRLMLLGGLRYLLPVIDIAHKLGIYVITCDYLPDNIAHKYSDEYCNVSVVDKEAVLRAARRLNIDGIMSFAVDPGVVTAAYVQDKMGLPACGPYKSVEILQNKEKFRIFLAEHGFNVPKAIAFYNKEDALHGIREFAMPVIVKPTDSAGSKGVTRVDVIEELSYAVDVAFENSLSKKIIIEEFIEKQGCSSDSDCFSVDGDLKFISFSAQRFDPFAPNPYTPSAYSWPSTMTVEQENILAVELQRLIKLLKMRTSIYNVETRIGIDGKPYIMEVSPSGEGNRIAEMLRYSTGVDLIDCAVRAAVGEPIENIQLCSYRGHFAEIIMHTNKAGHFKQLDINEDFCNQHVKEIDLWVKENDEIFAFRGANDAIGTLVLQFSTKKELIDSIQKLDSLVKVKING